MYYRFISTLSDRLYQQRNPDLSILIPIIDLIKQRQFFLALRLCDHLIGLNNELYSIHAIKSYVLYLSNCSKQALEIYNKLSKDPKGPANFDPDYVHFISFTLISTGQQESLLKLYEVASGSIFNSSNEIVTQHAFLALAELGRPKEQQQIALKLHKAFPENTRYLYWALISLILQMPDPNNQSTIDPKHSLLFSIAHRFLKTLLNQKSSMKHKNKNNKNHQNFSPFSMNSYEFIDNTSSSLLEIQNEFWVIVKVLELIGGWKPAALDPKRLVGVGGLSYDVKLFNSDVSPPKAKCKATDRQSLSSKQGRLNVKHRSKALKIGRTPSWKPLIADGSAVPQSLKLVRQDYLDLFDSDLGKDLRGRFLGLELMWRDRASEWANPEGLIELISRMIFALFNGDRNWHTMITINKALINLMRLDSATGGQLKDEVYKLFESLDSDQRLEGGSERGYSLALIDLENRLREGNFDGKTIEMGERLNDFVLDYFKSFSEKTCLFDDLAGYLRTNMTFKEVEQLIAMVEKSYEEDEIGGDQKKMASIIPPFFSLVLKIKGFFLKKKEREREYTYWIVICIFWGWGRYRQIYCFVKRSTRKNSAEFWS
ncbi:hypothetical protein BY996DRAFT_3345830 [Phakopsora pachyrhizi]|nr:hypothetical protein BY996DRAFT_3345830 [Phakopsora pachyrhizi]